jgi:hypothetical protein
MHFSCTKAVSKETEVRRGRIVDERLKRYEALLQEKGIDPNQVAGTSEARSSEVPVSVRVPENVWTLPPQATIFKPSYDMDRRA